MSIIETFAQISQTLTKMFEFAQEDELAAQDLDFYYQDVCSHFEEGEEPEPAAVLLEFVIKGRIGDQKQKYCDYYIEKHQSAIEEEKNIARAIGMAIDSIFEVKKVLKNGFDLYNIINEKMYSVLPLVKMSHFRGVYAGQYLLGTIINYENESFLIEVKDLFSALDKEEVKRLAVAYMLKNPSSTYIDNEDKTTNLPKIVKETEEKFLKCFGTNEIITTSDYADKLILAFDKYCHDGSNEDECRELIKNLEKPAEFKYFDIEEFDNATESFIENSLEGFSAQKEKYDVGLIFEEGMGLYVIPFYGTLKKIFEVEDYNTIEGAQDCVCEILESNSVPDKIIRRLANEFPNFMKVVNEILESEYTLETLLQHYKYEYLENKMYSTSTVLFTSQVFASIMDRLESADNEEVSLEESEPEEEEQVVAAGVGRNDPCPCGSGKKYKKCCMNKNEI